MGTNNSFWPRALTHLNPALHVSFFFYFSLIVCRPYLAQIFCTFFIAAELRWNYMMLYPITFEPLLWIRFPLQMSPLEPTVWTVSGWTKLCPVCVRSFVNVKGTCPGLKSSKNRWFYFSFIIWPAQKLNNFCSSSLWTCLHHMVILRSQNKITNYLMILNLGMSFQCTCLFLFRDTWLSPSLKNNYFANYMRIYTTEDKQ